MRLITEMLNSRKIRLTLYYLMKQRYLVFTLSRGCAPKRCSFVGQVLVFPHTTHIETVNLLIYKGFE